MKTFSELDHMRVYRQTLMVPFDEKNKKKGTVVHLLGTDSMQAEVIIQNPIMKNPNLIEGYYIDKSIAHLISGEETIEESILLEKVIKDKEFKNPKEFASWMHQNIKYRDYTVLMTPDEVLATKHGSCHDQALFEYAVFSDNFSLSKGLLFFVEYNENEAAGGMTHTLLYFKENNKYYWFENAWGGQNGIHGPFNNLKELKLYVESCHEKLPSSKRYPKLEWCNISASKFKAGINLGEYVSICFNESVNEEYVEEAGVGTGMAAGYLGKLALDVALKYSKKYIDAREAKTPAQKATAAKVFSGEYNRGKKAFEKFKERGGDRALKGTTPDAWWISWFGIDSNDIKAIGFNEKNKVKNTKFYNMIKDARGNTKIAANYVDEFDKFLAGKEFYLISSGVEDNGKVIPFKVEYFYCPQVDKIFNCSVLNGIINIDYKHPISISDYLNRSKASMLEIKDVLKICKENEKE